MPIYTYTCSVCNENVEQIRSISERDAPLGCPRCSFGRMRRQVSAPTLLHSRQSRRQLTARENTRNSGPSIHIGRLEIEDCPVGVALGGGTLTVDEGHMRGVEVGFSLQNGAKLDLSNFDHSEASADKT